MTVVVISGGGTGGHLYPALAIASALTEVRPEVEPYFVGAERGIEARVLPERGLPHTLVEVEGLRRGKLLGNLGVVYRLAKASAGLVRRFRELSPAAVVLTGGYASAPAGFAALFLKLPIVVQEQNESPGLTTRLMARWADQIHLAYPEAREGLPAASRARARETGNPIRPPSEISRREARARFGLPPEGPVILVVGGSQGSVALNRLMADSVRKGLVREPVSVLWAAGTANYEGVVNSLEGSDLERVRLVPYIDDMPGALAAADLAVSRSGAMTTSELLAWGVPAILVPLPTAAADHQTRNAVALEGAGVAVHLPEEGLEAGALWEAVEGLIADTGRLEEMGTRALERARPEGARDIALGIAELLPTVAPGGGR